METISRFTPPPAFLRSAIRPFLRSRPSLGRLRSHNYNLIKPQIRERRSKQRWRWEQQLDPDPTSSESEEEEEKEEDDQQDQDTTAEDAAVSDEELAEEMEVLEKEAMDGPHEGRHPSDYDRRAHIFHQSSRVFKVLKDKNDNATGTGPAADK